MDDFGPPPVRPCDGCQACCIALEVAPLAKPEGVPCGHLTHTGCGIYADRPDPCRGFACSWAMGDPALAEDLRPDRCGVMVWVVDIAGALVVHVHELRPGALDGGEIAEALAFYQDFFTVRLSRADGTREVSIP